MVAASGQEKHGLSKMVQNARENVTFHSAFDMLWKVAILLITVLFSVIVWHFQEVAGKVASHETRLSVIEGNRYTVTDARKDYREFHNEIDRLYQLQLTSSAELRTWIENNYPPAYLKNDITELKAEIRGLRDRIRTMSGMTDI